MVYDSGMNSAALARDDVVIPDPAEQPQLRLLDQRLVELEARREVARLVGPDGTETPIPASVFTALKRVIEAMSRGESIALVPHSKELTTVQAAELLHVSRPFLVRELLGKEIPFEKVGSHHRVRLVDVLAYRERRSRERRRLLDQMTAEAQDMPGGYR
jgi:excisionase family DNA binding protein